MTAVRAAVPARPARTVASRDGRATAGRAARPEVAGARLRVLVPPPVGWARAVAAGAVVFFVALAVAVTIQGQRITTQERYDALSEQLTRARERNRDLRVAVARAESPEAVLEAARKQGMIEPGPVVAVPAGPAATVPGPTDEPAP